MSKILLAIWKNRFPKIVVSDLAEILFTLKNAITYIWKNPENSKKEAKLSLVSLMSGIQKVQQASRQ